MHSVTHGLSKPYRRLAATGRDYDSRFACATKNRRREYLWEMPYKKGAKSDFSAVRRNYMYRAHRTGKRNAM
jgi:hypothetical protein